MGTITNPTGSITTGSIQSADIFVAGAGSASAPSYSFSGDLNTGMYSPAADTLGWSTGGTLRWSVSTTAATLTLPLTVSDATQSTSTTTGSIIAAGGAGIAKNLNVGGTATIAGKTLLGTTTAATGAPFFDAVAGSGVAVFVGSDVTTDATNKVARVGARHYTNSEEPVGVYVSTSSSTGNSLSIGGGTGVFNAMNEVDIYTAATGTTTTGTSRWVWNSGGHYVPRADDTYNFGSSSAGVANVFISKTITAAATTGNQTINKNAGSVNFAAAASSLVITDSRVTANSVVIATVATVDATMLSVVAVPTANTITLTANAAATAETRVNFLVIN